MKRPGKLWGIATFCFRFAVIAPAVLAIWWLILPVYVWCMGQVSGEILIYLARMPIDALRVETDPAGILNSATTLTFYGDSGQRTIAIAYMVNNLPPFVILVLATPGLRIGRRIRALSIGSGILAATHVVFVAAAYRYADFAAEHAEVPQALGKFLLTLPFVLWIALAYWDKAVALFDDKNARD